MAKKETLNPLWIVLGVIAAVLIIGIIWYVGTYNSLVQLDTQTESAWAQVENQYQRRADLIPNLVATVQGAKDFEQDTILQVTEARSRWTGAQTREDKIAAADGLDSAIARLLVVVENYPDLKATQNFLALQDQLEGTENRIAVARMDYNNAVNAYNARIRMIPASLVANMMGLEKKPFFKAKEGADTAPTVVFS